MIYSYAFSFILFYFEIIFSIINVYYYFGIFYFKFFINTINLAKNFIFVLKALSHRNAWSDKLVALTK